jgi:hypothetical protein
MQRRPGSMLFFLPSPFWLSGGSSYSRWSAISCRCSCRAGDSITVCFSGRFLKKIISDIPVLQHSYSEAIHRLIREDLHANSVIPIRSWNNEIIGGTYRQEMARRFNHIIYPRCQLVENKFYVLKRKFNGDLKSRKFRIQTKEIANKMIVCNIHRFLQFLIFEVFYRAQNLMTRKKRSPQ